MDGPRAYVQSAVKGVAVAVDRVRPPARGVAVLLYHRVGAGSVLEVDLPTPAFDEQMHYLAARRLAITLDAGLESLASATSLDPDPVVVTFDDGTADIVEHALPVLVAHQVPALVYVATDFVEQQRPFPDDGKPLSWAALRDAVGTGLVTVGSHTNTHALVDRIPPTEIDDELRRSIDLIEERLGVPAQHFAYPKGAGGPPGGAADRAVRRYFRSAAIADGSNNPYSGTDVFRLRRAPIQTSDGFRGFTRKAAGGMRFEGTLRALMNRRRYAHLQE